MNINRIVSSFLKKNKTTKKEINRRKNKNERYDLVKRIFAEEIRTGTKKEKAIKEARKLGISFDNQIARQIYDDLTLHKRKGDYGAKVNRKAKPVNDRIPVFNFKKSKKRYFYFSETYLFCSEDYETKPHKIPKKVVTRTGEGSLYNNIGKYGFWSDRLMTPEQVEQTVIDNLLNGDVPESFAGSDINPLDFNECDIAGVKYVSLARAY